MQNQNTIVCLNGRSSLIVHSFSNKNLKKLYPDMKFISHFIRNTSDLKLNMLFLICGTLLYHRMFKKPFMNSKYSKSDDSKKLSVVGPNS